MSENVQSQNEVKEKPIKRYTLGEEIFSSVTHGAGGLLSIAGLVVLVVMSAIYSDAMSVVSSAIFGSSLIILYTMSTLYHAITNVKAKAFFRIMDHDTIFFLIAGTYTPYTLAIMRGAEGWVMFGIIWAAAIVGIVLNSINLEKFRKPSVVCYILMGWVIFFAYNPMREAMPSISMWFLFIGGAFYMVGVVFYVIKKVRYFHSIWHLFTIGGSVFHYFSILIAIMNLKN